VRTLHATTQDLLKKGVECSGHEIATDGIDSIADESPRATFCCTAGIWTKT